MEIPVGIKSENIPLKMLRLSVYVP
jgi:hypothetical protein